MAPKIERLEQRTANGADEQPSGSADPGRTAKRQYLTETSHNSGSSIPRITETRLAKRPRNEGPEIDANGNNSAGTNSLVASNSSYTTKPSRTPSAVPESAEWMRARIKQLEADLESAIAARDLAVSEQHVAVVAHQAEQKTRREAMAQKSAAEAAQSRAEAEQMRLQSELESRISQKSLISRGQDVSEPPGSEEQEGVLERDVDDTRDQQHKLQLRSSHLELELEKAHTEIGQLKSDLSSARETLGSTQRSLESFERKYSSTRRKYEISKEKLGTYKSRLQNERSIVKKLQETLTPDAYKSLGATHETLGAFLSAMGLPPVNDEGNTGPKEESD